MHTYEAEEANAWAWGIDAPRLHQYVLTGWHKETHAHHNIIKKRHCDVWNNNKKKSITLLICFLIYISSLPRAR